MLTQNVLDRVMENCPEAGMARIILENALPPEIVDDVFEEKRDRQYHRTVLMSRIVELLSLVVCKIKPSFHAALVACQDSLEATKKAFYDKLNGTEPEISATLVSVAYQRMAPIVQELDACRPPLIDGYRTRIVDGNHLAGTEHRLKVLRTLCAAPLPGVSVVVYDRELGLVRQVYLDEDAYTQERALMLQTLSDVEEGELWIADRNFCTTTVLCRINDSKAAFIIRKHATNVPFKLTGDERMIGKTETGIVYEQPILILDGDNTMASRRVRLELFEPTQDGESEIILFSNLPSTVDAIEIAEAYRKRWDIEVTFFHMDRMFAGEIPSLGTPRAALLAFCLALIAQNMISVIQASLRAEHGAEKVDKEVSPYYIGLYIKESWSALHMAWSPEQWTEQFSQLNASEIAAHLANFAQHINLRRMPRHPRGPKKPQPERTYSNAERHVSTARLLELEKLQRQQI